MIAHYLTTVLFPQADIVIDMHTGGRSVDFYPCAHMHLVPDKNQRRQMLEGTEAWNSDFCFLYADIAGTGLLPVEAESQGKIVITTEMGGGETVPAAVHRITQSGVRNVLVHFGVLQGEKQTRASLGLPPARWVQALDRDDYQFAPESGIYETLVTLGDSVSAGQPVGQIHFLERPDREPVIVTAPSAGVLIASRAPSLVAQGDCVACIAHDVDPRSYRSRTRNRSPGYESNGRQTRQCEWRRAHDPACRHGCFLRSVEERDQPSLVGKAVIVGGSARDAAWWLLRTTRPASMASTVRWRPAAPSVSARTRSSSSRASVTTPKSRGRFATSLSNTRRSSSRCRSTKRFSTPQE